MSKSFKFYFSRTIPPCSSTSPQVHSRPLLPKNADILPKCFEPKCEKQDSESSCAKAFGCVWCKWEAENDLETPFCTDSNECYGGVKGKRNPFLRLKQSYYYNWEEDDQEDITTKRLLIIGVSTAVVVIISTALIFAALYVFRKKKNQEETQQGYFMTHIHAGYTMPEMHSGLPTTEMNAGSNTMAMHHGYTQEYHDMGEYSTQGSQLWTQQGLTGDHQNFGKQQMWHHKEQPVPDSEIFDDF